MASIPITGILDNGEEIINWEEEATAIIRDVKCHVKLIEISPVLKCDESKVYLNIRTIEGNDYCVCVSSTGFRVVGNAFDSIDDSKEDVNNVDFYETPYALLGKISPRYMESFSQQLSKQLLNVQQMQMQSIEEDEQCNE